MSCHEVRWLRPVLEISGVPESHFKEKIAVLQRGDPKREDPTPTNLLKVVFKSLLSHLKIAVFPDPPFLVRGPGSPPVPKLLAAPVLKSSIRRIGPSPWETWGFKGRSEVNISSGSGMRDPQFDLLRIEIMRTDCTPLRDSPCMCVHLRAPAEHHPTVGSQHHTTVSSHNFDSRRFNSSNSPMWSVHLASRGLAHGEGVDERGQMPRRHGVFRRDLFRGPLLGAPSL